MASGGSTSGENRLKSYKTKGLTLEESRRKREEEGVQLRKSKRDEQVRDTVNPADKILVSHQPIHVPP